MGYGCAFWLFSCLGWRIKTGVKKGGVLAFIGVLGGLLFFSFLFTPGVFRFISPYCYTDRCWGLLALIIFVVLAAWPCLYLGSLPARIYTYSVILIPSYPEPSERKHRMFYGVGCPTLFVQQNPIMGGCTGGPQRRGGDNLKPGPLCRNPAGLGVPITRMTNDKDLCALSGLSYIPVWI